MSGGVDSSVAALLLKKQGYDVYGVFMKEWIPPDIVCTSADDRIMASRVAAFLGIPFTVWDFSDAYEKKVAHYMLLEYKKGRTPNPDIMCNKEIKFKMFLNRALKEGADFIATGHYIKKRRTEDKELQNSIYSLFEAEDKNKDQTYFLWTLTQKELMHSLFPIGEYTKNTVRALAKKAKLPSWDKKDSQGVCFVGQFDFAEFLRMRIPQKQGDVLNETGNIIGTHDGTAFYTIGQRHGFNISVEEGGMDKKPLYVSTKDMKRNTITVVENHNSLLAKKELTVSNINWITEKHPKLPLSCLARIRYRQPLQDATLQVLHKDNTGQKIESYYVTFKKPQKAVTPGQSIVFYANGGEMIGGGIIAGL